MPGIELIRSFLQQATAQGSRSTVLTELRWFVGILLSAILVAVSLHAAQWILIILVVFLCAAGALYLIAYVFFGLKNPDALRSEKYTLTKLAIERSVTGDSVKGFFDLESQSTKSLPSPTENSGNA